MTESVLPGDGVITCPNCQAMNAAQTVVCVSCGVRLDTYDAINDLWQEQRTARIASRIQQTRAETATVARAEEQQNRKAFIQRLLGVIVVAGVLIGITWTLAFLADYRREMRVRQFAQWYTDGELCFEQHDYLCARDAYWEIYKTDPTFRDVKRRLTDSRLSLAAEYAQLGYLRQAAWELDQVEPLLPGNTSVVEELFEIRREVAARYSSVGRWQDSINQLEKVLEIRPDDRSTLNQLAEIYDRWYQEALQNGRVFETWRINRLRKSRFPH